MPSPTTFTGEIKVASRIIDYLSSGLYASPGACLKELVNNAYDADASIVNIFVKPDADRIIIEDDGIGLNQDEFVRHFDRVSESHKREGSDTTGSGRPKIGKIGIGFIAANEICDEMEIFSTRAGSDELLHVKISFEIMRLDAVTRRRNGDDFAKGDYSGEITRIDRASHFTKIFLNRVRGEAKKILAGARATRATSDSPSLYGLAPVHIVEALSNEDLATWAEFDPYSQTLLQVALNVPVAYYDGWLPQRLRAKVHQFEKHVAELGFQVFYDGSEIRKPVVLGQHGQKAFIADFRYEGSHVAAKGYFYVQHGVLRPQDLNGILIRIRNAAVGGYDGTFLDFPSSEGTLFQRWISAEVWVDDRLEDALNIDRKTLRIAHPAYLELQTAVHNRISEVIKRARADLYQASSTERKMASARSAAEAIEAFATEELAPISRSAAKTLISSWRQTAADAAGARRLTRKYDVKEVYKIVLEVAAEIMTPAQLTKFVERLTKRLSE